jgi:cytochrome c-type biogenesis protein CcmH
MKLRLAALFACLLLLTPAQAVEPGEALADPALEARARDLSADLRCLVCQNQSIDDSHAPLAKDLRLLVRERLQAGDSDDQVRTYLVQRYGDFVLLKPPLRIGTLLLWGAPLMVLLAGGFGLLLASRRRVSVAPTSSLSADEQARLDKLLGG